ncbi:MAG: asparaginase [bacterium]|nr:asparaginase [bacterium]
MNNCQVSKRGDSTAPRTYRVTVWDLTKKDIVKGFAGDEKLNPHSVWKFFQAYATVSNDADHSLTPEEIAIMCSSNSGEELHSKIVESMLGKVGLSEKDLACGKRNFFRSKRGDDIPNQSYCDCGGKHAGFLTLARLLAKNDAEFHDLAKGYLDKDGTVQQEIVAALVRDGLVTDAEVAGWKWEKDGCGAPVPVMQEKTLSRLYAQLASGSNENLERMFDAAAHNPELIGGKDGRLVTELSIRGIREAGDVILKDGFGSVLTLSVRDGDRKLGIVIHDTVQDNFRDDELTAVLASTLDKLGLPSESTREVGRELYGQTFSEIQLKDTPREIKEMRGLK